MKKIIAGMIPLMVATMLHAEVKPLFNLGFEAGGDRLQTVTFTNGDTEYIKAGDGFIIEGGAEIQSDAHFGMHLLLGLKADSVGGDNGDVMFYRTTLTGLGTYRVNEFTMAAGLTYHLSPELDGDGVASNVNVPFEDALGTVIQLGYRVVPDMDIGLRATMISYDVENSPVSVDGDSIGMYLGFTF